MVDYNYFFFFVLLRLIWKLLFIFKFGYFELYRYIIILQMYIKYIMLRYFCLLRYKDILMFIVFKFYQNFYQ